MPDVTLNGSRWAPGGERGYNGRQQLPKRGDITPVKSVSTTTSDRPLDQYDRLLRRVEHKMRILYFTLQSLGENSSESSTLDPNAAVQFKLDFFEFYMLLERTLVHLLGIFRISVASVGVQSTDSSSSNGKVDRDEEEGGQEMIIGSAKGPSRHHFHLNVLRALEQPGPLRDALGTAEISKCLRVAKNLRNRWKTAGEGKIGADGTKPVDAVEAADVPSVEEFEKMLAPVHRGLLAARPLAERETRAGDFEATWLAVDRQNGTAMSDTYQRGHGADAMDCDADDPFEVMYDAMEIG